MCDWAITKALRRVEDYSLDEEACGMMLRRWKLGVVLCTIKVGVELQGPRELRVGKWASVWVRVIIKVCFFDTATDGLDSSRRVGQWRKSSLPECRVQFRSRKDCRIVSLRHSSVLHARHDADESQRSMCQNGIYHLTVLTFWCKRSLKQVRADHMRLSTRNELPAHVLGDL